MNKLTNLYAGITDHKLVGGINLTQLPSIGNILNICTDTGDKIGFISLSTRKKNDPDKVSRRTGPT